MNLLVYTIQTILGYVYGIGRKNYENSIDDLEQVQRKILSKHIQDSTCDTYEEFIKNNPITGYNDWAEKIEKQMQTGKEVLCSDVKLYQPTSGSTSKRKWIPYNKELLMEFDKAIAPWMSETLIKFPKVKQGTYYWSLSWLPNELRGQIKEVNDLELFSPVKRILNQILMAVPSEVSKAKNSNQSKLATITFLMGRENLSMISVWSPTFLLQLMSSMSEKKQIIAKTLRTGIWQEHADELNYLKAPKNLIQAELIEQWDGHWNPQWVQKLWPKLALISSWDTSTSKYYAQELKEFYPHVGFQGKGLFSTEGVVTIPYKDQYALAYQSHFYEFEEINTQKIYPSWEVKTGQKLRPIVSFGNGLRRYKFDDLVVVTGFHHSVPCFEFLGREGTVDLVGEKLDFLTAQNVLDNINNEVLMCDSRAVSLLAIQGNNSHYGLLVEKNAVETDYTETLKKMEEELCQHHHYLLARELDQLKDVQIYTTNLTGKEAYLKLAMSGGMIEGDIKIQSILKCKQSSIDAKENYIQKL